MAPADLPETCYVRAADGVHLAYQVVGDGELDLLLIPGPFSHMDARWADPSQARFFRHLASFSRLIMFDKRGLGLSDRASPVPTLADQVSDVLAVMDAVGSTRAATYGFFDGGTLACLFAAQHPERVASLVLYATPVRLLQGPGHPWGFTEEAIERIIEEAEHDFRFDTLLSLAIPTRATEPAITEGFARLARMAAGPGAVAQWMRSSFIDVDLTDVLPRIEAPTLVISRADDQLFPPSHGRHAASLLTRGECADIPGRDTLPWGQDYDLLADQIERFVTGGRAQQSRDRVLATLLFTDVIGSTATAAAIGDKHWRELLNTHSRVVAEQLGHHRGRLVKSTGDGALATFEGPGHAIRCARGIARDLRPLGIDIRAGVHVGEVEVMGDDIGGIAVHIAARVMAEAVAGEVLVSSSVPPLVTGSEFVFEDRGERQLKGVPGLWRLFAAVT